MGDTHTLMYAHAYAHTCKSAKLCLDREVIKGDVSLKHLIKAENKVSVGRTNIF